MRPDHLPSNHIVKTLKDLRRTIDQMKAAQRVGAPNLKIYSNDTGNSYDISVTLSNLASAAYIIVFTPDVQDSAFADLVVLAATGSPTSEVHPDDTTLWPKLTIYQRYQSSVTTSWALKVENTTGASHTFYLKLYVQSTDTGSIGVM